MINKKLRKALLDKLGSSPQALSQRIQKLKKQIPMTTEDAAYVIAQQKGIILGKYLKSEELDRVRILHQQISSSNPQPVTRTSQRIEKREAAKTDNRILIIAKEFKGNDPLLAANKLSDAKQMAAIYPLLYILENSIREVIDRIMIKQHGVDWFDSQAPKGLRDKVTERMAEEHKDSWHQKRGSRPIDYLDLNQLPALMRKIEGNVVPSILPSFEWFNQRVEEVYKSRCVLCHMNPLDQDNIQAVKLRLKQWQKQIEAKKNLIL